MLLHLLAPTAPEKAEGTCSTRHEGKDNLENLLFIMALPATDNVHGDEMGGHVAMYIRASVDGRAYREL